MNNLTFTPEAWEDYLFWQTYDKQLLHRINELIKEVQRTPFTGRGKPEPLRFEFQGCWSRRINQEHRQVYKVVDDTLVILSLRFHYK
ncbi:MAG: Txe/YoeB family addiction module toxin [Gammaproteobacteria bacterium]